MAGKRQIDDAALIGHLKEQLSFIRASSKSFDDGVEGEAKRIAIAVRVLLHDTRASRSILGQLGVKAGMLFVDTAYRINPRNQAATPGLVYQQITKGVGGAYRAPLEDLAPGRLNPPRPFDSWWSSAVTALTSGDSFNRSDYVLTVANKEGGAHVDPALDDRWLALTRDNALGWMYVESENVERPFEGNVGFASVRQIAYELERTFEDQLDLGANRREELLRPDRQIVIPTSTGRNDPCPCGSGKKFKRCHGA